MNVSVANPKNPFCLEPITLRTQFFGREGEIRRVLQRLDRRQSVSVIGPAKIGKTSFLSHVTHPFVRKEQKFAKEWIFVHLDSHSLLGLDPNKCYQLIQKEAIRQIKNTQSVDRAVGIELENAVLRVRATGETQYFGLTALFKGAQKSNLKLAISLDHFELLLQNSRLDSNFFSALRSLITNYEMAYLVASRQHLDVFEQLRPEVSSPFFNCFYPVLLNKFTPEESREFVTKMLGYAKVEFPEYAIDCILELGNNEPCNLQRAGYITFQMWQENWGKLQEEHCEQIRQHFGWAGRLHDSIAGDYVPPN